METPNRVDFNKTVDMLQKEVVNLKGVLIHMQTLQDLHEKKDRTKDQEKIYKKACNEILANVFSLNISDIEKDIETKQAFIDNYSHLSKESMKNEADRVIDLVRNYKKYIRSAKEYCAKDLIKKSGNDRVLKTLIKKDINRMSESQKIEFQTKLTHQLSVCKLIIKSFK